MTPQDVTDFPRPVTEIRDTWIPMPDGTRLSARIWMPEDAGDDPVPGILELLPYRKSDGTALRDARNAPYFAGHGYAVVRVDIRGTGDSEGVITDEYTAQELDDGVACIAWIAAQAWCSGKVGIMGISWGGFNGLQIAALQPPELHAVLTLCSTDDRYADDVHYWGGAMLADYQLPWATTMLAYNARPPEPEVWGDGWLDEWKRRLDATPPFIEPWIAHQRRDAYWKHASICEDPAAIRCPVFAVSGWADAYRDAVFRLLETLSVPRRGLVGPWSHAWPHFASPGPRVGFLTEALRWWDRWLKDEPNGIEDEPVLRTWIQEAVPPKASYDERPGRWAGDPAWPSPNVTPRPLYLGPSGASFDGPPASGTVVLGPALEHGVYGGRSCSYGTSYDLAVDQRPDDALATCFDSAPLTGPLDVLGMAEAELEIESDRPQALVAVRICDVGPDGVSALITRGVLNLAHRDGHEHPEPLEPGRRYRVRFPLHAIGYRVPAGHRIRVALSPDLWPIVWPSPEAPSLTVHLAGSAVHLPVRATGDDAPYPYPRPEQARQFDHVRESDPDVGTVTRDLATGRVTVVYGDGGGYTRTELGKPMRYHSADRDTFAVQPGDPSSATVTCDREIELSRGDWHTRVHATAEMTADATGFHVVTAVRADHGDDAVFDREWRFTVPRDHT